MCDCWTIGLLYEVIIQYFCLSTNQIHLCHIRLSVGGNLYPWIICSKVAQCSTAQFISHHKFHSQKLYVDKQTHIYLNTEYCHLSSRLIIIAYFNKNDSTVQYFYWSAKLMMVSPGTDVFKFWFESSYEGKLGSSETEP